MRHLSELPCARTVAGELGFAIIWRVRSKSFRNLGIWGQNTGQTRSYGADSTPGRWNAMYFSRSVSPVGNGCDCAPAGCRSSGARSSRPHSGVVCTPGCSNETSKGNNAFKVILQIIQHPAVQMPSACQRRSHETQLLADRDNPMAGIRSVCRQMVSPQRPGRRENRPMNGILPFLATAPRWG